MEKEKLVELVQEQKKNSSQTSWIKIAQVLETKSPRQCYDQWLQLSRAQATPQWTDAQSDQLADLVEQHGTDWVQLAQQFFPNTSASFLKRKYQQITNGKTRLSQIESSTSNRSSFSNVDNEQFLAPQVPLLAGEDAYTLTSSRSLGSFHSQVSSPRAQRVSQPYFESRLSNVQFANLEPDNDGFAPRLLQPASTMPKLEENDAKQSATASQRQDAFPDMNLDFQDFDMSF